MSRQQQARRALLRLALAVLPATLIAHSTKTASHAASPPGLRPYLKVVPPPPLRFHTPPTPAAPLIAAAAEPEPPPPDDPIEPVAEPAPDPAPAATLAPEPVATPATEPAESVAPPPILVDENAPTVRIEDILPFFEPPASPRPATLPPSSATYKQQ